MYCSIGYKFFSNIIYANSVIIPYGIHPFDICIKNPDLWKYIKFTFVFTYVFSSFIISNSFYLILKDSLKRLKNNLCNVWLKIKKFNIFSDLISLIKKIKNSILYKINYSHNKYKFFNSENENLKNKHKEINKPFELFVGNLPDSNFPVYLPFASL